MFGKPLVDVGKWKNEITKKCVQRYKNRLENTGAGSSWHKIKIMKNKTKLETNGKTRMIEKWQKLKIWDLKQFDVTEEIYNSLIF